MADGEPQDWQALSDEELAALSVRTSAPVALREQAVAEMVRRRLELAADRAERAARRSEMFAGGAIFLVIACAFLCWRACASRPVEAASAFVSERPEP